MAKRIRQIHMALEKENKHHEKKKNNNNNNKQTWQKNLTRIWVSKQLLFFNENLHG